MNRWKVRILVLLLLLAGGAIVNVAVAWGSAVWIRPPTAPTIAILDLGSNRHFAVYASSAPTVSWLFRANRVLKVNVEFIRSTTDFVSPPAWGRYTHMLPSNEFASECIDEARGWPTFALASGVRYTVPPSVFAPPPPPVVAEGIRLSNWPVATVRVQADIRSLPLRPVWPGFAINTVFYAFVLWLLFAAPFALRRLRGGRRIKRGLCPKCAYPVGTNAVCTECGQALK